MTLVPNLLVSGILSVLLALIFLAWATLFVQQKHAGLVLLLLSIILLLVGGGFGPPLLGIIVGLIATRIHMPLTWWRAHLPVGLQRMLARLWPWSYSLCLISWLYLFPGTNLHDYVFEINNPELVVSVTILSAFGSLLLTILTGIAHDVQRQSVARRVLRIGD